jgi:DNA-binding HxlR family transcriptional regulator
MWRCRECKPVPEEIRRAADLLERRWTVSIVYAAHSGAVRFNEFKHAVGPVPPRTLAQRLVDLEEAGILERRVVDSRPPRVEYALTERGAKLRSLIDAIERWATASPAAS